MTGKKLTAEANATRVLPGWVLAPADREWLIEKARELHVSPADVMSMLIREYRGEGNTKRTKARGGDSYEVVSTFVKNEF